MTAPVHKGPVVSKGFVMIRFFSSAHRASKARPSKIVTSPMHHFFEGGMERAPDPHGAL